MMYISQLSSMVVEEQMADNTEQMWSRGTDGSTLIHIDRASQPHQSLGRLFTHNLARDPGYL